MPGVRQAERREGVTLVDSSDAALGAVVLGAACVIVAIAAWSLAAAAAALGLALILGGVALHDAGQGDANS